MTNRLDRDFHLPGLLRFALPTIIMMLVVSLYTIVDGVLIARLVGENALAAANVAYPAISFTLAMGIMLGTGGSYLGFFTGNLTSLKVPCALNAMEAADVEPGTEAGEVISTIAIAVSALVTTAVIAIGVLLLSQIRGFLESPALQPAFDNILPALFGPLAVVYVAKNWKVAMTPLVFMIVLFICVPSLASSASVLVPVGALLAIGAARILYKKGLI